MASKPKPTKVKSVKVKAVKIRPMRGAGGRFVAKSQVKGKAKIDKFFAVLKASAFEVARKELRGVAEAGAQEIRTRIENQSVPPMGGRKFGLSRRFDQPLNQFTKEQKEKKGQDPRTLIATGFYVNHIGVVERKAGKGWTYAVGFTAKFHPSGIAMEKLGRIMEYGAKIKVTSKMRAYLHWKGLHLKETTKFIIIPARPHFGPTLVRIKREMKRIQKWTSQNITAALKKKLATL